MASEREQTDQMQERLDELGHDIDDARQRAEDDNLLFDPDEPRFYESGERSAGDEREDDQTIAPPG